MRDGRLAWAGVVAGGTGACALVVALVMGATAGDAPEREEASVGSDNAAALLGSTDPSRLHDWYEGRLVECMADAGEAYAKVPFATEARSFVGLEVPADQRPERGFGIADTSATELVSGPDNPNAATVSAMSERERAGYFAELEQCHGLVADEALRRRDAAVAALSPEDREFLEDAVAGATPGADRAVSGWAGCMEEKGFSFTDPPQMLSALEEEWAGVVDPASGAAEDLRRREIAAAVAETDCDAEHLAPLRRRLTDELAERLTDDDLSPIYP